MWLRDPLSSVAVGPTLQCGCAVRGELVHNHREYLAFLYPVSSSVEIDKSHQLHCAAWGTEALGNDSQKLCVDSKSRRAS